MYTLLGVCSTFIAGLLEHRLVKKRTYTHHRRQILIVFYIRLIKKRSTYMTINIYIRIANVKFFEYFVTNVPNKNHPFEKKTLKC